jgi:hypothetical protein
VDWPARFRAAAEVAEDFLLADALRELAAELAAHPAHVVEAIGRALLGEATTDAPGGE